MPQVINTNISSLNAQRNLNMSQSSLATSLQRLSSGLRINSAKDDAAGLAISDRMTAQIRGLNQAARNANDGISLSQTAEGALAEVGNNLQRIRELAIQSANSTNSATDRASLDAEAAQLIAEITRVSSTDFLQRPEPARRYLSPAQTFQVGANANQTISVNSIADSRATALGSNILLGEGTIVGAGGVGLTQAAGADVSAGNNTAVETDLTITTTGGGTTAAIAYATDSDAKVIAAAINAAASGVGVTATASNSATLSGLAVAGTVTMTLNGSAISAVVADPTDLTALMGAINGAQGSTGVTATFTSTSTKAGLTLSTTDGRDISILDFTNSGATKTVVFSGVTLTGGAGTDSSIKSGVVSLSSTKGTITLAGANTDVFTSATASASALRRLWPASVYPVPRMPNSPLPGGCRSGQVNVTRGDLGAYQNRFSSAIANLRTTAENVRPPAAVSRTLTLPLKRRF